MSLLCSSKIIIRGRRAWDRFYIIFTAMTRTVISLCICALLLSCADAPKEHSTSDAPVADAIEEAETEEWSETPMDFTPEGYVLYKTYKGDLNGDDYEDVVAVFNAVDSDDDMRNRAVMLLTTDADGQLTMAALNKGGALCSECGGVMGDPFVAVVIKNRYFTIEHFGGSRQKWTDDPTFKYNEEDGKWYLHQHSKAVHDGLDPENGSSSTILTTKDFGKVSFEEFRY